MAQEPDQQRNNADITQDKHRSARQSDFFSPRPTLSRGFDAYVPQPGVSRTNQTQPAVTPQPSSQNNHQDTERKKWFGWLRQHRTEAQPAQPPYAHSQQPQPSQPQSPHTQEHTQDLYTQPSAHNQPSWPQEADIGYPPIPGAPAVGPESAAPRLWERQPYAAIAHLLALSGTLTAAWLLGILFAQILPGNFEKPPLQESILRKSSRLTRRLWHLPQLWQSPTVATQITAIPIPTTGPIVGSVDLSPIERQPLIDELNAVETEVLTLDRRLQPLEKRLGQPPYEGADIETRINALRAAIDPPVRQPIATDYQPQPSNPDDKLLDVVQLKITLPSDALFTPGESSLKDAPLLTQVLDQLVNYPDATILVRSYSDNQVGTEASRNYTLEQANAIARHLQTALPTSHRWVTLGGGQTQPITENADAVQRQQNRRIEILVDTRS